MKSMRTICLCFVITGYFASVDLDASWMQTLPTIASYLRDKTLSITKQCLALCPKLPHNSLKIAAGSAAVLGGLGILAWNLSTIRKLRQENQTLRKYPVNQQAANSLAARNLELAQQVEQLNGSLLVAQQAHRTAAAQVATLELQIHTEQDKLLPLQQELERTQQTAAQSARHLQEQTTRIREFEDQLAIITLKAQGAIRAFDGMWPSSAPGSSK
jgi:hypothetical protein